MTLMKFTNPKERDRIIGPLFATEATADVPIFGAEKVNSPAAKSRLKAAIKRSLQSKEDPVTDLLAPKNMGQMQNAVGENSIILGEQLDNTVDKGHKDQLDTFEIKAGSKKAFSSRELHDKSHYSNLGIDSAPTSRSEHPDSIMLQRVTDGYMFDCQKNMALVEDDPWLQDVWEWIAGKSQKASLLQFTDHVLGAEEAARSDGMIAGPLDLSYLGVYTIWMNLLGMLIAFAFRQR